MKPGVTVAARAARASATLLGLVWLLAFAGQAVAEPLGRPLLWEVSSGPGRAYLLGSLHFGMEGMYPLDRSIEAAYAGSSAVVVEVDVLGVSQLEIAKQVATYGLFSDGTSLRDSISPATWARLESAAQARGIPTVVLRAQRPWLAALTLTTVDLTRQGYLESLGVDRHFLERARHDGLEIIELETLGDQLELLSNLSPADQELVLVDTLNMLGADTDHFADLVSAWSNGDERFIDALLYESMRNAPGADELYRSLVLERNVRMARSVTDLLSRGGTYFVVVGTGHLVGENGIPSMLRAQGLTIVRR